MTDTPLADLTIRVELPRDIPGVREVNLAAFGRTTEADLVGTLRENEPHLPGEVWRFRYVTRVTRLRETTDRATRHLNY